MYRIIKKVTPISCEHPCEYLVQRRWCLFWITEWSYGNSAGVRAWGKPLYSEDEANAWAEHVVVRRSLGSG